MFDVICGGRRLSKASSSSSYRSNQSADSHKPGRVEGARLLAAAGGGGSSSSSSAEMVIDTGALESVCFVSIQTTDNKTSL